MALHLVLLAVLAMVLCMSIALKAASVHFFVDAGFGVSSGHWVYQYNFSDSQYCINMGIFDDKVSSAQWRGLPQTGSFAGNQSFIAFYTDKDTAETNFPQSLRSTGLTGRSRPSWSGRPASTSRASTTRTCSHLIG